MLDSSNNQEAENPAQDVKSGAQTTVKAAVKTGKAAVEAGKIVGAAVSTGGLGGVAMGAKTLATKVGGGLAKKLFSKIAPGVNKFIDKAKNTAKKAVVAAAGLMAYPFVLLAAKIAGIIGAVGGVIGVLGGAANFIISLGSLSVPTVFLAVPFGVGVGTLAVETLHDNINITPAAFFSKEGDLGTPPPPGQNDFFTLTKTASPSVISAQPPGQTREVIFTITLTAKNTRLTSVQLVDQAKGGPGGSIAIPTTAISCTVPIEPNTSCTQTIAIGIDSRFNDSIVSNTVIATVTPEGQSSQSSTVVATVTVGTPSSECPSAWPTTSSGNGITQGPQGSDSHIRLYPSEQAIDIGVNFVPALATFNGVISDIHLDPNNGYGIYIDVTGNCIGSQFRARWAHLSSIDGGVSVGTTVRPGQVLATTGNTGTNTSGPHLHYSFFGLDMKSPYIPKDVASPSCNDNIACNVNW